MHESLEDLILKLLDIGFYEDEITREYIIDSDNKQKKELLCKIVETIEKEREIIVIEDNGCLILPNGEVNPWLLETLQNETKNHSTYFFVLSRYRVNKRNIIGNEKIFAIDVPEFDIEERKRLLKELLKIEDLSIEDEDIEDIARLLSGHPKQVHNVVEFIKQEGAKSLLDKSYYIRDWNEQLIENILKEYSNNDKAKELLVLLSKFDFIDILTLDSLVGHSEIYKTLLRQFVSEFICYEIGLNREYIKMNRIVSDAIGRYGWDIGEELHTKLDRHIEHVRQNSEMVSLPSYIFSTQEILLNKEYDIDKTKLLPSIALKTIITLYDKKKDFSLLIELANIVLYESGRLLDREIKEQMMGYLCAAYLRKREYNKFKEEVHKINGVQHEFLMGLYYRMIQNYQKALKKFDKALELNRGFNKAKREKVRVYIAMRDFQTALGLAEEQYKTNKNNHYAFQAYLSCLLKTSNIDNIDERNKIEKIFSEFEVFANTSNKAEEMYRIEKAKYKAALDKKEALDDIDNIQRKYPDSPYPLMAKFEIALKFNNIDEMEVSYKKLKEFENLPNSKIMSLYKAQILKKQGKDELAKQAINELKESYPQEQFERIEKEIQAVDAQKQG